MEKERFQFSCVPYVDGEPMKCDLQYIQHFWDTEKEAKVFAEGIAYGIELMKKDVCVVTYKNVGETCDVYRLFDIFNLGRKRPLDIPLILGRPEIYSSDGVLVRWVNNGWVTCESEAKNSHVKFDRVVNDLYFFQLDDDELTERMEGRVF